MKREITEATDAVIEHLEIIAVRAPRAEINGGVQLPEHLQGPIIQQLADLKTVHLITRSSKEVWRHLNDNRVNVTGNLMLKLRGFWTNVENNHRLGLIDARVIEVLEVPSIKPASKSPEVWKSQAERTLEGLARAAELGIDLVTQPGSEELAEILAAVRAAEAEATDARLTLRQNQARRRRVNKEAIRLINAVANHISFALFGQPKEMIREILRGFGFHFKSTSNEVEPNVEPGESEAGENVAGGVNS